MTVAFKKAARVKSRLRMAIDGLANAGKTFTSLRFAFILGNRVAVIASEVGAAEKYQGLSPDGTPWEFDVCELTDFSPAAYTEAILAAGKARYDVLIVDSLSHAWAGSGGALELVSRKDTKNTFTAWKDVTPLHNRMLEAINRSPCHIIATMRSKIEHILEDDGNGKKIPRKVGMAPVQREGMEYEFDLYCTMDPTHTMTVVKTRFPPVDGQIVVKPGPDFIAPVAQWLNEGVDAPEGYYAVTEEDLKASQKHQDAANPPSLKEKMARAGKSKKKATEQAAETAEPNSAAPGDECDAMKLVNASDGARALHDRAWHGKPLQNVTEVTSKPSEPIKTETTKLAVEEPKTVNEDDYDQSQDVACSATVIEQIRVMINDIEKVDPTIPQKIRGILESLGKAKIPDLTQREADSLLQRLYVKSQEIAIDQSTSKRSKSAQQREPS